MSPSFDAAALVAGLGETFMFAGSIAAASEIPASDPVRALIARMERLASIRELIDATLAPA